MQTADAGALAVGGQHLLDPPIAEASLVLVLEQWARLRASPQAEVVNQSACCISGEENHPLLVALAGHYNAASVPVDSLYIETCQLAQPASGRQRQLNEGQVTSAGQCGEVWGCLEARNLSGGERHRERLRLLDALHDLGSGENFQLHPPRECRPP